MAKDLYSVLGVERSATATEIKRAFRRLSLEHHPDHNPGDLVAEERFKEVSAAYEVLGDEDNRRAFDEFGDASLAKGFDPERARAQRVAVPGRHLSGVLEIPWDVALRGGTFSGTVELGAEGRRDVQLLVPVACFSAPPSCVLVGRGGAGTPPGNLIVYTTVAPSDDFAVLENGRDVACFVDVTVLDLVIARSVVVTTPWAQVVLVPRLTEDRTGLARERVVNHGIRPPREPAGALIVTFRLQLPSRDRELEAVLRRVQPPQV